MENRPGLKKIIILSIILNIIFVSLFIFINKQEYKSYIRNYNNKINIICNNIKEKYPNLSDSEIFEILTSNKSSNNFFRKYGYDLNNDAVIKENDNYFNKYIIIEIVIFTLNLCIVLFLYLNHNRRKDKDIKEIIKLVDNINKRNYNLDINSLNEEELSILKDEIYKITVMLREQADNSNKDKINLKTSLEDISHQLRTPLTAILINIDNILDNPNLDNKKKEEFLRKIKRESYNMKMLIELILKLSRLEVNTISFDKKKNSISNLINSCMDNVSTLADLKNINIKTTGTDFLLKCDYSWEVEAITNILKNAVEHAYSDSEILINYGDNKVYSKVEIINEGETIANEDLKHIFERFYKGKNSKSDSFGIGLSLAKAIVENDNGKIMVDSINNKTTFTIKYYK